MAGYDEEQVIAFQADVRAAYKEAKENYQIEDDAHVVWVARMVYDAADMGYALSRTKHLYELRQVLRITSTPKNPPKPTFGGGRTVVGNMFYDDNGPWRWKMITAFDAMRLFCDGKTSTLQEYADWSLEVGANGWRVFGNWSVTGLDYRKVPNYLGGLEDLCVWLATRGLSMEFVTLCDCNRLGISEREQAVILNLVADILARQTNTFNEMANEPWNNGVDPMMFNLSRAGLLVARGAGQDGAVYAPSLGYTTVHQRRTTEWYRYVGKDLGIDIQNLTRDAVVANEPNKLENTGYTPLDWERAAYNSAMFTAGMTVHGNSGTLQRCYVPMDKEDDLVRRSFHAMSWVPLEAPSWAYGRYGPGAPATQMPVERDQDDDSTIRLYAKVGAAEACALSLHHSYEDGWRPKGINGWTVVQQTGPFVLCKR
jgi:hypothetical protein